MRSHGATGASLSWCQPFAPCLSRRRERERSSASRDELEDSGPSGLTDLGTAVSKMEIYFKERKKNLAYTSPLTSITLENKDGMRARNKSLLKIYWVKALIFCGAWIRVGE